MPRRLLFVAALLVAGLCWWAWDDPAPLPKAKLAKVKRPPRSSRTRQDRPPAAPKVAEPELPASTDDAEPKAPSLHTVCIRDDNGDAVPGLDLVFYCSDTSAMHGVSGARTQMDGCAQRALCPNPDTVTCVRVASPRVRQDGAWVIKSTQAASQFRLAPDPSVRGQVQNSDGDPVVGAQLWFEAEDPDPTSTPPFAKGRMKSDEQGRFAWVGAAPLPCDPCVRDEQDCELERRQDLALAPTPGIISIRHPKYPLRRVPMPAAWGEMPVITLSEGPARLHGHLEGPNAARAQLMIRHYKHRLDRQVTRADVDGNFVFVGLGEGDYELSVFVQGNEVLKRRGVRAGAQLELELEDG